MLMEVHYTGVSYRLLPVFSVERDGGALAVGSMFKKRISIIPGRIP